MGLFGIIFTRVMAVVAAAIAVVVVAGQINQDRYLEAAWRQDLREEAAWTAHYFRFSEMPDPNSPPGWQDSLRVGWKASHDTVRMTLRDERGDVIFDSELGTAPPASDSVAHLTGHAFIERPQGRWELLLSRPRPSQFSLTVEIAVAGLCSALFAALLLFPLMRGISTSLGTLAAQAHGIAAGQFGATLPARGARELKRLAGAFNTMSDRLRVEGMRRQRLLSDVSHELRSPLGRLRALGETLRRHPGEYDELLKQSEEEIQLLDRLIADLIDAARLEENHNAIVPHPVELKVWWRQSIARLQLSVAARGAQLSPVYTGPDLSVSIDAQRLFQALANVVDNAVAASVAGQLIEVQLTVGSERWQVDVRDEGRGVPADALPFIFDRFYRVDADRGRATGGVGLGLSIVKAIVDAHGGSVSITSKSGENTCVSFSLPIFASQQAQ